MRKIINSTYITLDGVIQDPQDWPDNGIEGDGTGLKVQTDLLFGCDAMLMGARTYAGMAPAWMARSGDPFSDRFNAMAKYVVSSTLTDPEWNNSEVISYDEVKDLDETLYVSGSGTLVRALLGDGLLDELHLFMFPIALGAGEKLFLDDAGQTKLALLETSAYANGVVHLNYGPA